MKYRVVRARQGFTLIELLVVVAIIAVLLALLLPAVQKARDAANRVQCQDNLKQLALGLHNYHDANNVFPQNHRPPGAANSVRVRWFTRVLPYVEESTLHSRYDFTTNWDSATNLPVTSVAIKIAQCPSSPLSTRLDPNPAATNPQGWGANNPPIVAVTDYAGVYGVHPSFIAANSSIASIAGIQNPYGTLTNNVAKNGETAPIKLTDITDGTSTTLLLVESAGRPQLYNQGGVRQGSDLTVHGVNGGGWSRPASDIWIIGFADQAGTIPGGPYTVNAANGVDTGGAYPLTTPAGAALGTDGSGQIFGFHTAGANVAFADGSVRLLSPDLAPDIIAALATRANNDVVPSF
jgi:prepilin-type N-terminal cleavage/methylation domain-containing protein/prepilin-type processing-associated H-X9-DG protein